MRLFNHEFKAAMKGYKAIKTICKSAMLTLYSDEIVIQNEDVELSYPTTKAEDCEITIDDSTLKLMEKCKDDFVIDHELVKCGTRSITYHCEDVPRPLITHVDFVELAEISQEEMLNLIKGVKFAVSKDDIRPALKNILWDDARVVAVDGYRAIIKNSSVAINSQMLIPPTAYALLEKLLDKKSKEAVKILLDSKRLMFKIGEINLITSTGNGEFLNYKQVFTDNTLSEHEVDRKELLEKIEFLQQDKQPLIVTLGMECIEMKVNTNNNVLTDRIACKTQKYNNMDIAFNPKFLIESLKNTTSDTVTLQFTGANLSPLIIKHDLGKDLILPIKMKG